MKIKILSLVLIAILAISVINTCNAGIVDYRKFADQGGFEYILNQDSTLEGKFLRLKAIDYIEKNFEHNYTFKGCGTGVLGHQNGSNTYIVQVISNTDFEDVTKNQSYYLNVRWEYNYPNYDDFPTISYIDYNYHPVINLSQTKTVQI
ncbi:MAG: hypothetical protein LBT10_08950 [Methanobrevibacter sp.]|jgi:hypothetical protein|nr:hypothetical protein [Methanobrevibacter sp.]